MQQIQSIINKLFDYISFYLNYEDKIRKIKTQSIINKLPEVIKCIIYDHVSHYLNYSIELCSDKFIGNPIDLYNMYPINNYYHINKLTRVKTPLHFIGLSHDNYDDELPPQEILNKLQKFILINNDDDIPILPSIIILSIHGSFTKIPHINGLKELDCSNCENLTEIPHIVGLKKLNCSQCENLTEISRIKGLLELNCFGCHELIEIPHIVGLKKLICPHCHNLTKIPHIVELLELECSHCYNMTEIPHIMGLKKLGCSSCPRLIKISNIIDCIINPPKL